MLKALRAIGCAGALAIEAGFATPPVHAQAFDYHAPRGPALGRVSPAPSLSARQAVPAYRQRPRPVCTTRVVRDRYGDVVRRVRTCRDAW